MCWIGYWPVKKSKFHWESPWTRLADTRSDPIVRSIALSETFHQEENEELTAEERNEAEQEWRDQQLRRSDPQAYHALVATRSKAFTDMAALSTPFSTLRDTIAAPPIRTTTSGTEDARMALLANTTTRVTNSQHQPPNTARAAGAQDPFQIDVRSPILLPIIGSNTRTRRSSASASPKRSDGTLAAGTDGMHDPGPVSREALRLTDSATDKAMETASKLDPHSSINVPRIATNVGRPVELQDNGAIHNQSMKVQPAHSSNVAFKAFPKDFEQDFVIVGERTNGVSPVLRKGTGAGFLALISRRMPSLKVQNLYEPATPEIGQDVCYAVAQDLERLLNQASSSNDDYRSKISRHNESLQSNDIAVAEMLRRVEIRRLRGASMGKQRKDSQEGKEGAVDSEAPPSLPTETQPNVGTPPSPQTQSSSQSPGVPAIATLRRWLSARKKQTDS